MQQKPLLAPKLYVPFPKIGAITIDQQVSLIKIFIGILKDLNSITDRWLREPLYVISPLINFLPMILALYPRYPSVVLKTAQSTLMQSTCHITQHFLRSIGVLQTKFSALDRRHW
jgi:hypothetical protein